MKKYRVKRQVKQNVAVATGASTAPLAGIPSTFTAHYGQYAGLITPRATGGFDTRAADLAKAGIKPSGVTATLPAAPSVVVAGPTTPSTFFPPTGPGVVSSSIPTGGGVVLPPLSSWGTKQPTGWVTGVNPSVDLAHLAPSERVLTVSPAGRIFGGSSKSVNYLATSMDPAAVAWRARREAEGSPKLTPRGTPDSDPYGYVPGYKFIPDSSSQAASIQGIMKMPTLQTQAIKAGTEAQPPGWAGEGVDIYGGKTPTFYGKGLSFDSSFNSINPNLPGVANAIISSSKISSIAKHRAKKGKGKSGKPKKQVAKYHPPVVSVKGMDIIGFKGISIGSKKKKK